MKLVPCLLLLCTLSMTAGIPLASDPQTNHTHTHENHHRHYANAEHSSHSSTAEHSSNAVNYAIPEHNEGRNLLVSMFLMPKKSPQKAVIATPKIAIMVAAPKIVKPALPVVSVPIAV